MIKHVPRKNILSIADAPLEHPPERKYEKLGIIQPKMRSRTFRFTAETCERLENIKNHREKTSNTKINYTNIIEDLIGKASKQITKKMRT